jgi:site-specific DNA recombinase
VKKGVRYRYYVSSSLTQGRREEAGTIARLPAPEVESLVMDAVRMQMGNASGTKLPSDADLLAQLDLKVNVNSDALEITWTKPASAVSRHDGMPEAVFDKNGNRGAAEERRGGSATLDTDGDSPECHRIVVPYKPQPHKRRREIILPTNASAYVQPIREHERQNLLRAIAQGRAWLQEIVNGNTVTPSAIAIREKKSERSIRMTLSLAFLDPKLVRIAIRGSLPRGFAALYRVANALVGAVAGARFAPAELTWHRLL